MPWFKVDDAFHSHPKAMKAGTAALGLWVRCGSWVAQQLTDGYVPVDVVRMYGTSNQAKALVAAGLWDQVDGGYRFHEWHPTNPTRTEVEELRESKRTAGSAGGKASGKSRAKAKQSASTNEAPCLPSGSEVLNTTPLHSTPSGSNEPSQEPRPNITRLPPPKSPRTAALVEEHLQALDRRPSSDTIKALHRKTDECVAEGYPDVDIRDGLALLRRQRLDPNLLMRLVDQAIDSRPRRRTESERMFG